jgi:hypothetical protein
MSKSNSKSVYGSRGGQKQIYGIASIPPCDTSLCTDMFPLKLYLDTLTSTIGNLISVVGKFFPSSTSFAQVIADMSVASNLPPGMFVRLVWAKRNPGVRFINSTIDNIHLKQIYLEFDLDWRADPYLTAVIGTV